MKKLKNPLPCAIRQTWVPAALTHPDIIAIQLGTAFIVYIRASDYASSEIGSTGAIESAMPLGIWTVVCVLVSAVIVNGIILRKHAIIWLGHMLGWITYAALGTGAILSALDNWPPKDHEQSVSLSVWATLCGVYALSTIISAFLNRRHPRAKYGWGLAAISTLVAGSAILAWHLPPDGIRIAGPLVLISWLHLIVALRMGPRPLQKDSAKPQEVVLGEGT